jgi:hypothetical protein
VFCTLSSAITFKHGLLSLACGNRKSGHSFSGCPLFNTFYYFLNIRKVTFDTANYFFIDVTKVVKLHPFLAQVFSQVVSVESELQKCVHLCRLLAHYYLSEVTHLKFVKAEKAQIRKDLVKHSIVTIG